MFQQMQSFTHSSINLLASAAGGDIKTFTEMVELFAKGLVAFGGIQAVVGIVGLSRGLKDHAGQEMNNGITSVVAGGMIILAATILKSITL